LFIWFVSFFIISLIRILKKNFELLKEYDGRLFPTEEREFWNFFPSYYTSLVYLIAHAKRKKGGCETERATTLFLSFFSYIFKILYYKNSTSGSKFSERTGRRRGALQKCFHNSFIA
jgi:hypothetical protein